MLERIKKALVRSFVGPIAIGWLFADGILRFVSGVTSSLMEWLAEWIQQPKGSVLFPSPRPPFPSPILIREWFAAALILLAAFLLLRWLYIEPSAAEPSDPSQVEEPEESA
jgi:hypothetical protein